MLAKRVIPILLMRDGHLVKGKRFDSSRIVGHALQSIRIYQQREVDELAVLDVTASGKGGPDFELVKSFATECYMPLTVGGGIKTVEDVKRVLKDGADKVVIGSAAITDPKFITAASRKYGAQAITVAIDVKNDKVCHSCAREDSCLDPVEFARKVQVLGAGEILLTSVDRDGSLDGYDLPLVRRVSSAVSLPIVAAGGAGEYSHFVEALEAGAHAVAAGAMWQFTDATPKGAAKYLRSKGYEVRTP